MKKVKALDFDSCSPIIDNKLYKVSKKEKFGVITIDGEVYAEAIYDEVSSIKRYNLTSPHGQVPSSLNKHEVIFIKLIKDGKMGLLTATGNLFLEPVWEPSDIEIFGHNTIQSHYEKSAYTESFVGSIFVVVNNNGQKGAYSVDGKLIVPMKFDDIKDSTQDYKGGDYHFATCLIATKGNKKNLYTFDGKEELVECTTLHQYHPGSFCHGTKNSDILGIYANNKHCLPCDYEWILSSYYCMIMKNDTHHHVILPDGSIAFSSLYEIKERDMSKLIFETLNDDGFPIVVDKDGKKI